jgi:hypothetical protein
LSFYWVVRSLKLEMLETSPVANRKRLPWDHAFPIIVCIPQCTIGHSLGCCTKYFICLSPPARTVSHPPSKEFYIPSRTSSFRRVDLSSECSRLEGWSDSISNTKSPPDN